MAAPEQRVDLLEHDGPWTEQDVLALPVDRRIELVDGSLLVSPTSVQRHQWLSFQLAVVLNAAAPRGTRALEAVNVRTMPGRLLIPDLVVTNRPRPDTLYTEPDAVQLVVEITSPGNAYVDRALKPALYAQAGIPRYLRVELEPDAPVGHLHVLEGDAYQEIAAGTTLELTEPFVVTLDLEQLDDLDED